ncbi:serine hydrolase domain-containing protein [Tsuneonella sp. HG222]
MKAIRRACLTAALAFFAVGAFAVPVVAQQALPEPLAKGPPSAVPPAIQIARWHMNDADVNVLTFRSMDKLFTTRTVPRAGQVWHLPRSERPLDFTYAFDGTTRQASEFAARTLTDALIVLKDGRIVSEQYFNNADERTRFIGWSMTKSVTSLLVGQALAQGRIASLDDPIDRYLPELRGGGYIGVTIRQILQMRSGVDYEERYDFANPGTAASNHIDALVRNTARFADAARAIPRAKTPGSAFAYKTLDTAVLGWLLERVGGGSTVAAYTAQNLWEPLGAEADGFYIMDGEPGVGREFSGAGFNAVARDWARLGQMMLDGGKAGGRQVVPAEWIRLSTGDSGPTGGPMGYAMQWWRMGAPGAYSAVGLQGQYVYVDPASRTVVVKLSHYPPGADDALSNETEAFLRAVSAWTP